jgi:hypothetical protein
MRRIERELAPRMRLVEVGFQRPCFLTLMFWAKNEVYFSYSMFRPLNSRSYVEFCGVGWTSFSGSSPEASAHFFKYHRGLIRVCLRPFLPEKCRNNYLPCLSYHPSPTALPSENAIEYVNKETKLILPPTDRLLTHSLLNTSPKLLQ